MGFAKGSTHPTALAELVTGPATLLRWPHRHATLIAQAAKSTKKRALCIAVSENRPQSMNETQVRSPKVCFSRDSYLVYGIRRDSRRHLSVMAGHSRSENGVAEPVIGTRDFARSRWLAYVPAIHVFAS